jgi:hypothetical protein
LTKLGDFEAETVPSAPTKESGAEQDIDEEVGRATPRPASRGMRTEFHYNLQIHLPANGNEETYLNIFNAIRKTFQ